MKTTHLRRVALGLAAVATTFLAQTSLPSPASASVGPSSVTYFQFQNTIPKCLDVGGQVNGSVVQQFTCNGTVNQQWAFQPTDSGFFRLVVASSGRCLEVAGASQQAGARIQILDCNGGFNQQWKQQPSSASNFPLLVARHSGFCLGSGGITERLPSVQVACGTFSDRVWRAS